MSDTDALLINLEFRSLIPPLEPSELQALEESILEEGVRDAIVVWAIVSDKKPAYQRYIVDGHNRYDIIVKHKIPPDKYRVVDKYFPDIEDVKIWIKKNQLARRNISAYLRGEYVMDIANYEAKKTQAEAILNAHMPQSGQKGFQPVHVSIDTHISMAEELKDKIGVGYVTANRIIQIHEKAPDLIKEQARKGTISVNEAYNSLRVYSTLTDEDKEKAVKLVTTGAAKNLITARRLIQRDNAKNIKPPVGKYQVIYADPPWQYESGFDIHGAASRHYNTMTIDELCQVPIKELADDKSILFLWVTSPKLRDSFAVIEAWGFEYKTSFVWDKIKHVMGQYNSVRHEFLLVATRGTYPKQSNTLHDSVISVERSDTHSEKPEIFRSVIDEMFPSAQKIELFAEKIQPLSSWKFWGEKIGNTK